MDEAIATGFSLFYLFSPIEVSNCERPALQDEICTLGSLQHPSLGNDYAMPVAPASFAASPSCTGTWETSSGTGFLGITALGSF